MALLQSSKAIFYHPLDDSVEALKSQAWAGTAGFTAGKVSLGLGAVSGATMFGIEEYFRVAGAAVTYISVAVLEPTRFVVAWRDGNSPFEALARIWTVSGTSMSAGGAEAAITSASTLYVSLTALSSTAFVAAYRTSRGRG